MHSDELGKRLGPEQRGVRVGDHDGAVDQAQRLDHRADRVPGTALALLHDDRRVGRVLRELGSDLAAGMADHHDQARGLELARRGQDVPQHRAAADRVQHLRGAGLHPRALTRRKDDDRGRTAGAHSAPRYGCRLWAGESAAYSRSGLPQDTARFAGLGSAPEGHQH